MMKKETAHDAFLNEYEEVISKLNKLKIAVETKAMKEAVDQRNWGHAGDLAHINGRLDELLDFIGG